MRSLSQVPSKPFVLILCPYIFFFWPLVVNRLNRGQFLIYIFIYVRKRGGGGFDEAPDFYKQREDGQAVLCHLCQKPTADQKPIIPCNACSLFWHLDCLDPPMAIPPVLKTWRCPAHVDEVLTEFSALAPAHRMRKLKRAPAITPLYSRGMRNNGLIDVTDDLLAPVPDSAPLPSPVPANATPWLWPDSTAFGRTFNLSARGIVLDTIER